jgi:septal ring factor EnvC (AmiA/AmiB activator)
LFNEQRLQSLDGILERYRENEEQLARLVGRLKIRDEETRTLKDELHTQAREAEGTRRQMINLQATLKEQPVIRRRLKERDHEIEALSKQVSIQSPFICTVGMRFTRDYTRAGL